MEERLAAVSANIIVESGDSLLLLQFRADHQSVATSATTASGSSFDSSGREKDGFASGLKKEGFLSGHENDGFGYFVPDLDVAISARKFIQTCFRARNLV